MPYTLIKGSLHIHYPATPRMGPEPDGDTLKFLPDNRQFIENLPRSNRSPKFTQSGITTLRFEGIDALETHFSIEGEEYHQQMNLALTARNRLLDQAGFGDITYFQTPHSKLKLWSSILSEGIFYRMAWIPMAEPSPLFSPVITMSRMALISSSHQIC